MTLLVLLLWSTGCKKPKPEPDATDGDSYDQTSMFQNYANNLILPAYQLLQNKLDSLYSNIQTFNSTPNSTNLGNVRSAFLNAYKQYMYTSTYEFGPALSYTYRSSSNVFPTDTTQINSNISAGVYDLNQATQIDAIGFPALDYILFGKNKTDLAIINLFHSTPNRKQYLLDLCVNLQNRLNLVISGWGSYSSTFTTSLGNSAGASLSNLVNELNFDYEITKNARVGIPLGKQTLGVPLSEKCEAYYSSYSLVLLAEHVNALEGLFLGRSQSGNNGNGLDDYLDHVGATWGSTSLNAAIQTKFTELKSLIALVPGPLSNDVISNPAPVENVYAKLQELLVLLKTDLPSALSVYITYVDGDGD